MFSETEIHEGTTRIIVPEHPTKSIFYNPVMELCRDIDIASIAAFSSSHPNPAQLTYIDALAGTGVRGVRVANEVGLHVTINDRSTPAYELIKRNIALNAVEERATAYKENANVLLLQTNYDLVDIDPFGSPVPFLDAAAQSVKKLLLITATDTAPLCGAHTGGMRNYSARPLNTEYHAEMATRILLGAVTRELARYDKAIQPLLSYASAHFVRLIVRVEKGARKADECIERLGFIAHCFFCGHRFTFPCADMLNLNVPNTCALCGQKLRVAGPLYLHPIKAKEFCEQVHLELGNRELGKKHEALKIVHTCIHELDIPFYYEHHALCKSLKLPPTPLSSLIDALHSNGFSASRTQFSDTAVKTNARIDELKTLVKALSTEL
ncbi:MAG: tRNA (guanine(10)-N(2))-dimethyltransferase [Methanophagales archaeon ANME-1-THS]|nr:MAG: tRNA (guanine(10)-N(2))-dimethyltransferase [Methanophagales archaeon ANME-1-THS]